MSSARDVGLLILPFLPALVAAIVGIFVIWALRRAFLARPTIGQGGALARQSVLSVTALALALLVTVLLPLEQATRGQLLSFFGIVISATIALSSTSFIGNAMAGIMLRLARDFEAGDFVTVEDHFGRVIERGLLHTEIQNENRDRVIFPNLQLITSPVTVVHRDGTVVSALVSLGYDVPRLRVERLLLGAAESANLAEPFVQVRELGDFSVVYRVAGLLSEPKRLLSVRSDLRCRMLDALHEGGVEIVSPNFMNQRVLDPSQRFVPVDSPHGPEEPSPAKSSAEDVVFDKAEEAESLENLELLRASNAEELDKLRKQVKEEGGEPSPELQAQIQRLEKRQELLDARITRQRERSQDKGGAS